MAQIGKALSHSNSLPDPSRRRFFRLGVAALLATSVSLLKPKDAHAIDNFSIPHKKEEKPVSMLKPDKSSSPLFYTDKIFAGTILGMDIAIILAPLAVMSLVCLAISEFFIHEKFPSKNKTQN